MFLDVCGSDTGIPAALSVVLLLRATANVTVSHGQLRQRI
jgi:hypothetical protein